MVRRAPPSMLEAADACSKQSVARLMREANLRAPHGNRIRRWATKPAFWFPTCAAPVLRVATRCGVWADIIYVLTWLGWLRVAGRDRPLLTPGRRLAGHADAAP